MRQRFRYALAAYGLLATLACATLDGKLRWFVLILLVALAVKSWVAVRRDEHS